MIYFIGNTAKNSYESSSFEEFKNWVTVLSSFQLDIETNVTNQLPRRKVKTIQIGTFEEQWVLQWNWLTEEEKEFIKKLLENKNITKYIHNAIFEYTVLLYAEKIKLENVIDTLLQEKILYTGLDTLKGFYSLKETLERYLGLQINKEEQTSFDVDEYTNAQIQYAATDVKYLTQIDYWQREKLQASDLMKVVDLENTAVLSFGDIVVNGMLLDIEAWRANYDWAKELREKDLEVLNNYLRTTLKSQAIKLGFYKDKDELNINWGSPKQKKLIFGRLFPDLEGVTKPIILKYVNQTNELSLLDYLEGDYQKLEELILSSEHKQFFITNELVIPKDSITINWNSTVQRLELFKTVEPQLKDTSKQSLATTSHPIIKDYIEFIDTDKLVSSYGESFIVDYVDDDGYIRTNFDQILNTGRVSSSSPKYVGQRIREMRKKYWMNSGKPL